MQLASVRLQMTRIAEAASRRAEQAVESPLEKQRASLDIQRRAFAKQRASVERQLRSVWPDGSLLIAEGEPAPASPAPASPVSASPVSASPGQTVTNDCGRIAPSQVDRYVAQVAKRESLAPELLHLVIAHESSFLPCAVSRKGALGMMQLMPATAAELGVTNPFDPHQNIAGGARYLNYLLRRFGGDLKLALAAYNAGPTRVDGYGAVPPIPETISYVSSILRQLRAAPPTAATTPKTPGRT